MHEEKEKKKGGCHKFPKDCNSIHKYEGKSFNLIYRKENYHFVLQIYLPHIIKEAKKI